jgi:hypothetical protein
VPYHSSGSQDRALDELIHGKSRILSKKLEILASEMFWRLHIAGRNIRHLAHDESAARSMLNRIDLSARYGLRDHQEKNVFYRKLFDIETERRIQHTECWRDVVAVMRDFLTVWDGRQQAKSRAMLLENVGTRPQGYL